MMRNVDLLFSNVLATEMMKLAMTQSMGNQASHTSGRQTFGAAVVVVISIINAIGAVRLA
jgi:hypothetical protein